MTLEVIYDISFLGLGWKYPEGRTGVFNAQHKLLKALSEDRRCKLYLAAPEFVPFALKFFEDNPLPGVISLPPFQKEQKLGHNLEHILFHLENLQTDYKKLKIFHFLFKAFEHYLEKQLNKKDNTLQGLDPQTLKKAHIYHSVKGIPSAFIRQYPVRIVTTIHDLIPLLTPQLSHPPFLAFFKKLLKSLKPGDAIVTPSDYVKKQIIHHLKWPENLVFTTPYGISEEFRIPKSVLQKEAVRNYYGIGDAPYFLTVGRQDTRKNLVHLIKAFLAFEKKRPGCKLVMVGPASDASPSINAFLHESSLIYTGFIPEEDLSALYQSATAFIYPSYAEGFGLPVIEAMASGTPVITTALTSLPEVAGPAALYISPDKENDLIDALMTIFDNPSLSHDLKTKGLVQASSFTWENTARETLSIYEKMA